MSLRSFILLIAVVAINASCKVSSKISSQKTIPEWIKTSLKDYPNRTLGVMVYNPSTKKSVLEYNSDKNFVPASNIKIYTLYSAIKNLDDSLVAIKYNIKNDTLNILATGDPTLLHPDFNKTPVIDFIKNSNAKIIRLNNSNFEGPSLGAGWAWDDYNDNYQAEISAWPIYGNIVRINSENYNTKINPKYFNRNFSFKDGDLKYIKREYASNIFYYTQNLPATFSQDIPFKTSDQIIVDLLSDTLKKPILLSKDKPISYEKNIKSINVDTVYKRMMYVSDNMLAEQLMLMIGGKFSDTLSTQIGIKYTISKDLADLPQPIKWVDGSGLSRYNLTTPANTVKVLENLYTELNQKRLFSLFPAGGKNGTMKKYYNDSIEPYVYAKSGSLSGVYNQSGYVYTKSGKWLIFSIMNNNFIESSGDIGLETSKIVKSIRDAF
jgi:D-alanyl-D-alanine carboxypeptidase/D-alanyl-D-alanine-endopeptidase (penicillin-binding protein 4)